MKEDRLPLIILFVFAAFGIGFLSFYLNRSDAPKNMNDDTNTTTPTDSTVLGLTETNPYGSKIDKYQKAPAVLAPDKRANKKATITTNKGVIEFKFFGDEAPMAVSNFLFLANDKFYDGLIFHRSEEGFVIQGGDPAGQGWGGPGYSFADEPVKRPYTRGIVAMANAGPDTNGSQFFIMLADVPLPPAYTIFGEVTKGMEVVDQIRIGDKMESVVISDI